MAPDGAKNRGKQTKGRRGNVGQKERNEMHQISNIQSHAQADGFSEADETPHQGKRVICSGKSGPAWDPEGRPLAMALARSLQAQALVAAGDVLMAIRRNVLGDVFPAWSRLLSSARIEIVMPPTVEGLAERMGQQGPTRWDALRDVVLLALTHMESLDAARHWLNADLIMRATAQQEVTRLQAQLNRGTYDDGQPYAAIEHGLILSSLNEYRRYASGRL